MKSPRRLFQRVCLLLALIPAALSARNGSETAEADWQQLEAAYKAPHAQKGMPRAEAILAYSRKGDAVGEMVLRYMEQHPTDPRRWTALQYAFQLDRSFVTAVDADVLGTNYNQALTVDTAAKQAWQARLVAAVETMLAAEDVPVATAQSILFYRVMLSLNAPPEDRLTALKAARAGLELLEQRYPEAPQLAAGYNYWLDALGKADPTMQTVELARLQNHPNARVAQLVRGLAEVARIRTTAMELKFTAVDGREVDLAQLRGKVVLIDFWASWCGPCIAELPNIKKVYAEYHDRGFEIVGIALENARLTPQDTPEQVAAKLVAAKQVLNDFTAKETMTWPQYFDGKWWKNDISTQYAINGIPAMFLLDQAGKLVSTNARGERLEAEVKRLLKL